MAKDPDAVHFRLTPQDKRLLDEQAEQARRSRSFIARDFVEKGLRGEYKWGEEIDPNDRELLKALGNATDCTAYWHVRQAVRQYLATDEALELLGYATQEIEDNGNVTPLPSGR